MARSLMRHRLVSPSPAAAGDRKASWVMGRRLSLPHAASRPRPGEILLGVAFRGRAFHLLFITAGNDQLPKLRSEEPRPSFPDNRPNRGGRPQPTAAGRRRKALLRNFFNQGGEQVLPSSIENISLMIPPAQKDTEWRQSLDEKQQAAGCGYR